MRTRSKFQSIMVWLQTIGTMLNIAGEAGERIVSEIDAVKKRLP